MMRRGQLRASALFYAVTIGLIAGMVTGAMLWMARYRTDHTEHWLMRERLASNLRTAAHAAAVTGAPESITMSAALFEAIGDSAAYARVPFGVLDLVVAEARLNSHRATQWSLVGGMLAPGPVLNLDRQSGPLHLSGDARIMGDARIARRDVRRGYIEGRSYTGDQLVYGLVAEAEDLPELSADLEGRLTALCAGRTGLPEHEWTGPDGRETDLTIGLPVLVHRYGQAFPTAFPDVPFLLRCSDTLVIPADARINQAVILAPYIRIEEGAALSAQCFAQLGIEVGRSVLLRYPSVLCVRRDEQLSASPRIVIGDSAVVQGAVIAYDRSIRVRTELVKLAHGATLEGELYATGSVEIRGTVIGRVDAKGLSLRTPASSYFGYLLDGRIEPCARPDGCGLGIIGYKSKRILAWGRLTHHPLGA